MKSLSSKFGITKELCQKNRQKQTESDSFTTYFQTTFKLKSKHFVGKDVERTYRDTVALASLMVTSGESGVSGLSCGMACSTRKNAMGSSATIVAANRLISCNTAELQKLLTSQTIEVK